MINLYNDDTSDDLFDLKDFQFMIYKFSNAFPVFLY